MHFLYIIQSQKDHSFYIGYSNNPENRLIKHNKANSGYTAKKKPWILVYTESFSTKAEALARERFIKNQKSAKFLTRLISNSK